MKKFYEWKTQELFDEWHNKLMTDLDYPIENINQATGLPDGTFTEIYTQSFQVDGKVIAVVDEQYADGLVETELRLPKPELA